MALNPKKVQKKNNADKALEILETSNSAKTTISTLNKIDEIMPATPKEAKVQKPVATEVVTNTNTTTATSLPPKTRVKAEKKASDNKGRTDKGLGLNQDGSFRQSNAGRSVKAKGEKKVQMTLTVSPKVFELFKDWASDRPRSATSYISEFLEENSDAIINYYKK